MLIGKELNMKGLWGEIPWMIGKSFEVLTKDIKFMFRIIVVKIWSRKMFK